ncbi:MAG: TonB-dependent receptor [Bacteroidetes bacterium]|nr:TonB-dependent receptor [Bacteroidota bacterium]
MKKNIILLLSVFFISNISLCQNTGVVKGNVKDKETQEALIGASVIVDGTIMGSTTDKDGNFKIENIPVGSYNIKTSYIGYKQSIQYNIIVTSGNYRFVNFEIESQEQTLKAVNISIDKNKTAVIADLITPLSVQSLTTTEIQSNPGGNFDISKVVQALPGVASATSGSTGPRNDIIIRGGAPNENVYYLDGIEIPQINHFATQGSSGGAAGILNVSFIEDVKLSSSAFDARYDNALSSVFQIKQRQGNQDKFSGNFRLSGTETAITCEGPLTKKTNFLASVRRSYLQVLFKLLDLPIRPNYWDFQYKVTHKINSKTTLTIIGVGAIDEFSFASTKKSTPDNEYILRSTPFINQWNYTNGFALKRLINKGYMNFSASRNMFNNQIDKFEDRKNYDENFRQLKFNSQEIENRFRFDYHKFLNHWKYSIGASAQYVKFNADVFNKITNDVTDSVGNIILPGIKIKYYTAFDFFKFGLFGQVSKHFYNEKLGVSFGVRSDMNSFTDNGFNPINTLSPRVSLSYQLTNKFQISSSVGSYFKLPVYTSLGYRDSSNTLKNKNVKYIKSIHYVAGFQYLFSDDLRFTLEGFYKDYRNYPVSDLSGISIANLGSDFAPVGNEKINSIGKGRAYGFELYSQKKLTKKVFAVVSYTFVRSEFAGKNNKLIPSSWDNKHLLSMLFGYKFNRNWEMGLKYRFAGGSPYTPYDLAASQLNYVSLGTGIPDYSQLNNIRLKPFNQLDLRIDKKVNFKNKTLELFIDIQNVLLAKNQTAPTYNFKRNADNTAFETTDNKPLKSDGSNGIPVVNISEFLFFTPTIGIIFEF